MHLRICAYLAGLGEIGYSKMLLTPEFGPRLRIGVILTEMELEPDPIYDGPQLCNKCMACVKNCPGNAISGTKTVKVNLAGHEVEWGELDCRACQVAFQGGRWAEEGEKGTYFKGREDIMPDSHTPFYQKPKTLYNSGQAVCGARGCTRACTIALEARGVMKNKFKKPFRRKPLWSVDWSDYEPVEGNVGGMAVSLGGPKMVTESENELAKAHEKEPD